MKVGTPTSLSNERFFKHEDLLQEEGRFFEYFQMKDSSNTMSYCEKVWLLTSLSNERFLENEDFLLEWRFLKVFRMKEKRGTLSLKFFQMKDCLSWCIRDKFFYEWRFFSFDDSRQMRSILAEIKRMRMEEKVKDIFLFSTCSWQQKAFDSKIGKCCLRTLVRILTFFCIPNIRCKKP